MSDIETWITGVEHASIERTETQFQRQSTVNYPLLPTHHSGEVRSHKQGTPPSPTASNWNPGALPNTGRKRQIQRKPIYAATYRSRTESENDQSAQSYKAVLALQNPSRSHHGSPESDKENVAPSYPAALSWSTIDPDSPIPTPPKSTIASPCNTSAPVPTPQRDLSKSLAVPLTPFRPLPNSSHRRIGTPNGPFSVEPKRRITRVVGGSQKENLANIFKPMAERKNETLVELSLHVQKRRRIPDNQRPLEYWDNDILPWMAPARIPDTEGSRLLMEAKISRIEAGPRDVTSEGKDVAPRAETTKVEARSVLPPWRP